MLMTNDTDLYNDFNGYNAYPLKEAEKIIRSRFGERIETLIAKIHECVNKAKGKGKLKLLSEVEKVRRRITRMKKVIDERDLVYVAPYLKDKITRVDEEKLKSVDYRVAELISMSEEIVEEITCGETDVHILDKFKQISDYFREMENKCHERSLLLKKDVKRSP
jgi:hypothetical protein